MQPMIVFSHLRWDFVYQRPQHLMSRLAKHYRVYFFEEPIRSEGPPRLEITEPEPGVRVCRPHTPVETPGFATAQLPVLQKLLDDLMRRESIAAPVVWMYTPMALPLVQGIEAGAVVYDCMDELSAFLNAPPELIHLEYSLLKLADLVFTGGPSLFKAKQALHPHVHCFPSSVDREHFARAQDPANDHGAQRHLDHPRLGFFGVLDERFDPVSVALLADAHPQWQIVLVGPIVKIDPENLPYRPNIHYMGQRPYAELPDFLAGWDVALLPFAINDATRYISPTKVLEYMAGGKPVVSSPIVDVVEPYGHIVHVGRHSQAFVTACERALSEPPMGRAKRAVMMRNVVAATSWDATATKMRALIDPLVQREKSRKRAHAVASSTPHRRRAIIIGAGPTGLSAAYHLGKGSLLIEQHDRVGGWCRSVVDNGFTFDCAGHIMFSNDPYVHEMYGMLLGDNVHWQDREAWIYSKGVHTRYPFQGALHGLPPDVLKECIVGAIEARFGPLKAPPAPPPPADCCADAADGGRSNLVGAPATPAAAGRPGPFRNFEEFIHGVWGSGVAKHFALPYNRKLWTVPLTEMETSWLGGRVPMPDLEEMIDGALRPVPKPQGPNARFGYPLRGGFQALMDGFLPQLRGELRRNVRVTGIRSGSRELVLSDGSSYTYDSLISTMPLPVLIRMLGDEVPARVKQAAQALRHVSVRCVNLGIARPHLTDKHWVYYPEQTVFHRIFMQGNASPFNNPPGGFGLTCEITYSAHKPLPCDGEALIDRCIADCIDVGMFGPDDAVIARNQVDMPYAYVVYDHARAENVDLIRHWLRARDIELAGRYSEWEYYNSDHAFLAGKNAAERVEDTFAARQRSSTARDVVSLAMRPAISLASRDRSSRS